MSMQFREANLYCNHSTSSDDLIAERVSQLLSLLSTMTGEGYDSFARYNEDIKHNVISLCRSMVEDIQHHIDNPDEHLKGGNSQ